LKLLLLIGFANFCLQITMPTSQSDGGSSGTVSNPAAHSIVGAASLTTESNQQPLSGSAALTSSAPSSLTATTNQQPIASNISAAPLETSTMASTLLLGASVWNCCS
jgi:hypothetical protein